MAISDRTIGAAALAAGLSRRMGRNKLLAPINGKPVIRHVVDRLNGAFAEPVLVVTGHQAHLIDAATAGARTVAIHAADYAAGMSASLRAAIAAVPPHWDAVLLCLGDMPLLSADLVRRMVMQARPDRIVAPYFEGKQANPVLWGRDFFAQLLTLSGDSGAKAVMAAHSAKVVRIDWPSADPFRDVDTPEALAIAAAIMRRDTPAC